MLMFICLSRIVRAPWVTGDCQSCSEAGDSLQRVWPQSEAELRTVHFKLRQLESDIELTVGFVPDVPCFWAQPFNNLTKSVDARVRILEAPRVFNIEQVATRLLRSAIATIQHEDFFYQFLSEWLKS